MKIPCALYRAGTSKVAFFLDSDLPQERDELVLRIFGSPDPRQIDGIGGGDPLTSKAAYLSVSSRPDADLDYTAAYVNPYEPIVDTHANCGNTAAGVLPFALHRGLTDKTSVTVYNTNSSRLFKASIEEKEGQFHVELDFLDVAGVHTGQLLPTGRPIDRVDGADLSIVDAFDVVAFVHAQSLGMRGDESAEELQNDAQFMAKFHHLRHAAADLIEREATPAFPKIAMIVPGPESIYARTNALTRIHKAYPVSGGVCLGVATQIPGTIAHREQQGSLTIEHPAGQLTVDVVLNKCLQIEKSAIHRTARLLMDGLVYL